MRSPSLALWEYVKKFRDDYEKNPLKPGVVGFFIKQNKADVNFINPADNKCRSILLLAIDSISRKMNTDHLSNVEAVIEILINSGADINAKDVNGRTPFTVAIKRGASIDIISSLIDAGVDVDFAVAYKILSTSTKRTDFKLKVINLLLDHADSLSDKHAFKKFNALKNKLLSADFFGSSSDESYLEPDSSGKSASPQISFSNKNEVQSFDDDEPPNSLTKQTTKFIPLKDDDGPRPRPRK